MEIHYKRPPNRWQKNLVAMEGPARPPKNLPKIENRSDLIAFCKKSPFELIRFFGAIVDPKSTEQEILSFDCELIRQLDEERVLLNWLSIALMDGEVVLNLNAADAGKLLKSENIFEVCLALSYHNHSTADLIDVLFRFIDDHDIYMLVSTILNKREMSTDSLRDLAENSGDSIEWVLLKHPNTPLDILQHVLKTTRNFNHVLEVKERIEEKKGDIGVFPVSETPDVTFEKKVIRLAFGPRTSKNKASRIEEQKRFLMQERINKRISSRLDLKSAIPHRVLEAVLFLYKDLA